MATLELVAGALCLVGFLWANHQKYLLWQRWFEEKDRGPEPGPAAHAVEVRTIRGETRRLSDYFGEPVLLEFWTTWCRPCERQMRQLAQVWGERPSPIRIVAVNVKEELGVVAECVKKRSVPFEVLLDPAGDAAFSYRVRVFPTTLVLNADGRVVLRHEGAISDVRSFLDEAKKKLDRNAEPTGARR
jgi:thiol-disulfide isomerase/thioredoxin